MFGQWGRDSSPLKTSDDRNRFSFQNVFGKTCDGQECRDTSDKEIKARPTR